MVLIGDNAFTIYVLPPFNRLMKRSGVDFLSISEQTQLELLDSIPRPPSDPKHV